MDGAAPPEEDYGSLSVAERLLSKNWKARVSAYNELAHAFKTSVAEDAPEFTPYLRDSNALAAAIKDSNAVAQEAGVLCACAFVEFGGKSAASASRDAFTAALVEKNIFGTARAGTKKAAVELCLLLVECDGTADTVIEACIEGLKSKQPKSVAGAVLAMKEIVRQFGAKTVNVKPILKVIPTIFAHPDKGVRAEGALLVQELHRWLGSALDPSLADLKPVQQKELAESFVDEMKPVQTRFTRTQQRERALKEAEASLTANDPMRPDGTNDEEGGGVAEEEPLIDAYDMAEPQQVLNRLPAGFYDNLASAKWKDRKELALDPLLEVLKVTPRVQDGNYDDLIRSLAGRMTDANIACVISAAGCIERLAKGLRQDFARYKSIALAPVLERCKEKKASVTDALAAALDAIFQSISISDIVEDVLAFSKHKNPQVKEQAFRFLVRSLRSTRIAPSVKTDVKPLSDALLLGMEDGFAPVRDSAAESLGTLHRIVGDRAMAAVVDTLDDIKRKKVLDFSAKAEVRCKGAEASKSGNKAAGKAAVSMAPKLPAMRPGQPAKSPQSPNGSDKENKMTLSERSQPTAIGMTASKPKTAGTQAGVRASPALASMKRTVPSTSTKTPASSISLSNKAATAAPKSSSSEPLKYRFTQEEAEAKAETTLPSTLLPELRDPGWKIRLAALENLQTWVEGEGQAVDAELLVRIMSKTPGWKESNFQVYGKMANVFNTMAQTSATWSRACCALTVGPLSDKLGDIKLKKPVGETLVVYSEKFSLQFTLSQAYETMTKQKAPKGQSEALAWIEQALRDFGVAGVAVRDLVEFLKNGLKSSNASVRTSAIKTLVTLRLFVGPEIKTFLQDLNPTLLSTIDSEFEKVNGAPAPEPTKRSADNEQPATAKSSQGPKGQLDPLDDLFPRQDIGKLISGSTIKGASDANWKQRKEALETMQSTLEANPRLKPNLGELGSALKLRLPDSNKVVQSLALDIIARLAIGIGKPFERSAKTFVGPICSILSDAKSTVRAPAIAALGAIEEQCGLDCMLPQVAAALEPANPVQRSELASWLAAKIQDSESPGDLSPLVGPVIACLEDKNSEVRKAAQALLPSIITSVGFPQVLDRAAALKPASRSMVIPMLEAAKAASANTVGAPVSYPANTSRPAAAAPAAPSLNQDVPHSKDTANKGLPAVTRNLRMPASATNVARSSTPNQQLDLPSTVDASTPARKGPHKLAMDKRPTAQPTSRLSRTSSPEESLFRSADESGKQSRAAREVGPLKWFIDGSARPDQIEYLQQQILPHATTELASLMFSKDHNSDRDHIAALAMLSANAKSVAYDELEASTVEQKQDRARLLANSDLVLKYITIRLCDQSSTIVLHCLDVIEALLRIMVLSSYHLSDYEAGAFLPSIIAKLGDGKEPIRSRAKAIIRALGTVYPSSKVFAQLLEHGSQAKSARCRAESIEEIGIFIKRQGLGVCQPKKALPAIASLIADKDPSTRSAVLETLANAYSQVGDDIFRYIHDLPPKDQTMLDERLKRLRLAEVQTSQTEVTSATPQRPSSRQSLPRSEVRPAVGKLTASSRLPAMSASKRRMSALPVPLSAGPSAHLLGYVNSDPVSPETLKSLHGHQRMVTEETLPLQRARSLSLDLGGPFAGIQSQNIGDSVDVLKKVQKAIVDDRQSLVSQASALINAISAQMTFAFDGLNESTPQPTLRLCKHLMQTLSGFFDQQELSLAVPKATLAVLLEELTKRLLETADSGASDAIVSLSKVLNMVLIRIFHNSDNSACFGSLFLILEKVTFDLRGLQGEELASQAKYAELVMKCLWKISKSVRENLDDGSLDPKQLLLDIDRFLQAIPPAEWRRRASDGIPLGDMPLRTVKTVLQQVVATYGDSVYDQLSLLDKAETSFVYQYLFRLLNNSRSVPASDSAVDVERPSSTATRSSIFRKTRTPSEINHNPKNQETATPEMSSPSSASTAMSPTRSSDIQMNLALKDIFDKIGNAQESKRGIAELYQFKLQHPEAETRINTWIAATGSFFQSYLRRALSNLAAEEAERAGVHIVPGSPQSSRPSSYFPSAPASPKPEDSYEKRENASPDHARQSSSRVTSGSSIATDQRLDSLKQMFGVPRLSVTKQ